MTGIAAAGPMSPSPSTAVPSVTTATGSAAQRVPGTVVLARTLGLRRLPAHAAPALHGARDHRRGAAVEPAESLSSACRRLARDHPHRRALATAARVREPRAEDEDCARPLHRLCLVGPVQPGGAGLHLAAELGAASTRATAGATPGSTSAAHLALAEHQRPRISRRRLRLLRLPTELIDQSSSNRTTARSR